MKRNYQLSLLALLVAVVAGGCTGGRGKICQPCRPYDQPFVKECDKTYITRPFLNPRRLDLKFDFYKPTVGCPPYPLIVLIHGGFFVRGDKADLSRKAAFFAERGYAVANINYRTVPMGGAFPGAVADVQRFVQFARAHAGQLCIDPCRIAAVGESAGAYLAAWLGVSNKYIGSDKDPALDGFCPKVKAVVGISGVYDFTESHDPRITSPQAIAAYEQLLRVFVGVPLAQNPQRWREASPISHVTCSSAPFFLVHGDTDLTVPLGESQAMYDALRCAGVLKSDILVLQGMDHDLEDGKKLWTESIAGILQFLSNNI